MSKQDVLREKETIFQAKETAQQYSSPFFTYYLFWQTLGCLREIF
jgi:hypothetical protein